MINQKYSFKDFMGHNFSTANASEFNNTEIVGSCFYQENKPDAEIFPSGMTGVTFKRCNLDNVKVPAGNTVESDCCNRKIKVQNDLEDWVLDGTNSPVEPVAKKKFIRLGLSIDPTDIPADFEREEELTMNGYLAIKDTADFKQWFDGPIAIVGQETIETHKEVSKAKWDAEPNKSIWESDFNTAPVVTANGSKIIVKGNITKYRIRGKGKIRIDGIKPRPYLNKSVTQVAMEAQE